MKIAQTKVVADFFAHMCIRWVMIRESREPNRKPNLEKCQHDRCLLACLIRGAEEIVVLPNVTNWVADD